MNVSINPRNHSLDMFRLICAFLVIIVHSQHISNVFLQPAMGVAVPCFFMLSGYNIYDKDTNQTHKNIQKALRKTIYLLIYISIIYALLEFSTDQLNIKNLYRIICFNRPIFGAHLWYLYSYLYILLLIKTCHKFLSIKWIVIPLLLIQLILGKYSFLITGSTLDSFLGRNFLFMGLPFFLLGYNIKKESKNILNKKPTFYFFVSIALYLTTFIEFTIFKYFDIANNGDLYITTIPFAIYFFKYFISVVSKKVSISSKYGREYSLDIYLYHMAILTIMNQLIKQFEGIYNTYLIFRPILVFVLSILLSISIKRLLHMTNLIFKSKRIKSTI